MTKTLPVATTEAVGIETPKYGLDILTKRPISHDEAYEIAGRLINSHFRKEPHARASIPAKPDYDDDLLISAYIQQQRTAHTDLEKVLEAVAEWWNGLPSTLRQDIEGSGAMPGCIAKVSAALTRSKAQGGE